MSDYKFEKNRLYGLLGKRVVQLLKAHKCIIAGGTITSMFTNREVNDFDIYFRSKKNLIDFIYDIWSSSMWVTAATNKATLIKYKEKDLQFIHFDFFETPEEIFKTFDFSACMGAFDFETEQFILHDDFLRHNSQRVLRYNAETSFPIVSLLRVDKYKGKGYEISKAELIRIILTCMNLDINTWDDLKEQLGGMYGINYDKMFEGLDDSEFSFDRAIEYISSLTYSEKYYESPEPKSFDSAEELIESIFEDENRVFVNIKEKIYKVGYNGTLRYYYSNDLTDKDKVLTFEEFFKDKKFYKFVRKDNEGKYLSFYKDTFEYKIGEEAIAENSAGLFFNLLNDIHRSPYSMSEKAVLLEVECNATDIRAFKEYAKEVVISRCKVLREVPKDEWAHITGEDELPFGFE